MQSACALVAAAALLACGCGESDAPDAGVDAGPRDAGRDALRDAPIDSPRDAPLDAVDAPDAPDGALELALEVLSTDPCSDWAVLPPRPRALRADATPRQLWRWFAYDDPLYPTLGTISQFIGGGVAIGADGNLCAIGPEPWRVMSIDPTTARLRWVTEDVIAPDDLVLMGPVTAAPDGSVFVRGPQELMRVAADGAVTAGVREPRLPLAAQPVAIGPHGRVYLAGENSLVATCHGTRALWRARLPSSPQRVVVVEDGSIWIAAVGLPASLRVSPAGAILERAPAISVEGRMSGAGFAARSADVDVFAGYDEPSMSVYAIARRRAASTQIGPFPRWPEIHLDPTGAIWVGGGSPVETERLAPAVPSWRAPGRVVERWASSWAADALLTMRTDAPGRLVRVDFDGATRWGVDLVGASGDAIGFRDAPGETIALDVDGVAYVTVSQGDDNYVIAVQTDVLPPEEACSDPFCNARHTGSVLVAAP